MRTVSAPHVQAFLLHMRSGSISPAEALAVNFEISRQMQRKHAATDGSFFRVSTNKSWGGGLAETLVSLLFGPGKDMTWMPDHADYVAAALLKTAGTTSENRSRSTWKLPNNSGPRSRGRGSINDVDLFVSKNGLKTGFWSSFSPSVPTTMQELWSKPGDDLLGCQVKMRTGGGDEADREDALHWSYFVEPGVHNVERFLESPAWLPHPVDLFAVLKIDITEHEVSVRGRLLDKESIRGLILEDLKYQRARGNELRTLSARKFSIDDCMRFPGSAVADISAPLTHLLQLDLPS